MDVTDVQHCTRGCSQENWQEKEISYPKWKTRIKLSLFADDTILYVENPKETTEKMRTNKQVKQSFRIEDQYTKLNCTLAGVAQWTECQTMKQRVAVSIPGQGTCLGCRPGSLGWGAQEATTH